MAFNPAQFGGKLVTGGQSQGSSSTQNISTNQNNSGTFNPASFGGQQVTPPTPQAPAIKPFLGSQALGNAKQKVTDFFQKPAVQDITDAAETVSPALNNIATASKVAVPAAKFLAPVLNINKQSTPEQVVGDVAGTGINAALGLSMIAGNEGAPAEAVPVDKAVQTAVTDLAPDVLKAIDKAKTIGNVIEGGLYAGGQGASESMQNNRGPGRVLANTLFSAAAGLGLTYGAGKILDTVANWGTPLQPGEKSLTSKIFGDEAGQRAAAKSDPIAQEFQQGKRTLADTGTKIKNAIVSYAQKGRTALNAVFDKLPNDISFKAQDIVDSVNKAMEKVVGKLETSSGAGKGNLQNITDLATKTKFNPEEQKIVSNMVDKIKSWTNNTPRGIAELRRVLEDQFFRGDGTTPVSDSVVRNINTELKNLISTSSKEYGPALAKAVDDIDKVNSATKGLLDKDGNAVESKISAFAKKLNDPALNANLKATAKEIFGDQWTQIEKELKGFNNYNVLKNIKDPGLLKKIGIGAGAVTATGLGVAGLEKIFGSSTPSQ